MKAIKYLSMILVIIGALNWGLVGLFEFDIVQFVFGRWQIIVNLIYTIIGISAFVVGINTCLCKEACLRE